MGDGDFIWRNDCAICLGLVSSVSFINVYPFEIGSLVARLSLAQVASLLAPREVPFSVFSCGGLVIEGLVTGGMPAISTLFVGRWRLLHLICAANGQSRSNRTSTLCTLTLFQLKISLLCTFHFFMFYFLVVQWRLPTKDSTRNRLRNSLTCWYW